ncbi:MAG: DUF4175 family protein, partial [Rhodospirillales bacterium]
MSETPIPETAARRLSTAVQLARLAIRWERLWQVLWAPVAVFGLFIGIALTDVLTSLPDVIHAIGLALLALLFGFSIKGAGRAFQPVDTEQAARRVEAASGLKHRPLTALFDTPAADKLTADGKALWQAHMARALRATEHLSFPSPKPGVAALDQRGLRFLPVLVLFVGVLMGHGNPIERIGRAMSPIGAMSGGDQVRIDLWLTPPAYTGLAPSVFNNIRPEGEKVVAADAPKGGGEAPDATVSTQIRPTLIVPVGSQILVHATDVAHPPQLVIGKQAFDLQRLGDGNSTSYKLQLDVDAQAVGADHLKLSIGSGAYASWPIVIAADAAPRIEFEKAP